MSEGGPLPKLSYYTLRDMLAMTKIPNSILNWAHSRLESPQFEEPVPVPVWINLVQGKGKLKPETINYLLSIRWKGHTPSRQKILSYLRNGATRITYHHIIKETPSIWREWNKKAKNKIKAMKGFLDQAKHYGLVINSLQEIQDKITALEFVHKVTKSHGGDGWPWVDVENRDHLNFLGLSNIPSHSNSTHVKQKAWNDIIVPMVDYLREFYAGQVRRDKRVGKIPQGAYKATAAILNLEFRDAFPNDHTLVRQRYLTASKARP